MYHIAASNIDVTTFIDYSNFRKLAFKDINVITDNFDMVKDVKLWAHLLHINCGQFSIGNDVLELTYNFDVSRIKELTDEDFSDIKFDTLVGYGAGLYREVYLKLNALQIVTINHLSDILPQKKFDRMLEVMLRNKYPDLIIGNIIFFELERQ